MTFQENVGDLDGTDSPDAAPVAPKKSRRKIVIGAVVAAALVIGGTTAAVSVQRANTVRAFDAAVATINEQNQLALDATAHLPQANFLLVERAENVTGSQVSQLEKIGAAPAELIADKVREPVAERAALLDEDEAVPAPSEEAAADHAEISEQLEDPEATFTAGLVEPREDSQGGAEVTGATLAEAEADAEEATAAAAAAQTLVDEISEQLDQLATTTVDSAALVAPAARDALEHQAAYVKPFTKAKKDTTEALSAAADKLTAALERYDAGEAVETDPENPASYERLAYTHAADTDPEVVHGRAVIRLTAAYVTAALEVKKSHDAVVAAEKKAAEEAAAAEAAAAAQNVYTGDSGGWTGGGDTGWTGGGWTPSGGGAPAGGGGSAGSGGGSTGGGTSGGGGGSAGGGGGGSTGGGTGGGTVCAPPPAGWWPSGSTTNGCPNYLPPGGDNTEGW